MLDSLTFLWEKLFLLAHLRVFSLLAPAPEREEKTRERHRERDGLPGSRYRRGDLLEVPRTLFTHFGIYLGDDRVAHLIPDILPVVTASSARIQVMVTNNRLLLGVLSKSASVRVDSVEDFAYGACILRNSMDRALPRRALDGEEVARRAEGLVGATEYSLLWNNCEHFVTYCRYGTAVSLQTDKFCDWIKSVIRDQRSIFLTAFLGVLSILCLGMSAATALPSLLLPFTLWMAS